MLIWVAVILAFVSLGCAAYAEWTGDKSAQAFGILVGIGVLGTFSWKAKSVLSQTYIADNAEGWDVLVWLAIGAGFVLLYFAIGLRSLMTP